VGVVQQGIDGHFVPVDHVEDSIGKSRLFPEGSDPEWSGRVFFAGLQHDRVASGNGDREEPHGHHDGEVERANNSHNTEGLFQRINVDIGRSVEGEIAFEEVGESARKLDDLLPAVDFTQSVRKHLAVFFGDDLGELVFTGLEKLTKLEHNIHAFCQRHDRPAGKSGVGNLDGCIEVFRGGKTNRFCCNPARGVKNVGEPLRLSNKFSATDIVVNHGLAHGLVLSLVDLGSVDDVYGAGNSFFGVSGGGVEKASTDHKPSHSRNRECCGPVIK